MTRENRFTSQCQKEIFTDELLQEIDKLEENDILIPCAAVPLDVSKPADWCIAIGTCAIEMAALTNSLALLFSASENIDATLNTLHIDYFCEVNTCPSTKAIKSGIDSLEKTQAKILVEIDNIITEYVELLENMENFSWNKIKSFAEDIFDKETYELFQNNFDNIKFNRIDIIDDISKILIVNTFDDWNDEAIYVNKLIIKELMNDNPIVKNKKIIHNNNNILSINLRNK